MKLDHLHGSQMEDEMKKERPIPEGIVIPEPQPKPEPIDNTGLIEAFKARGGRVMHLRPNAARKRGMTIAFIQKGGRVELATSLQHRVDDFTKKVGTKMAIEHFNDGKTVTLPLSAKNDRDSNEGDWALKAAFGILL